jgi:cytochrome P450
MTRARVPGPRGLPIVGNLLQVRGNLLGFFVNAVKQHGDVVHVRLVRDIYLLNHPDHVTHVLQTNQTNYRKGFIYDRMRVLMGDGLVTSDGELWRRQRRLIQPTFHKQRIAELSKVIVDHGQRMRARWQASGGSIDVHAEMLKVSFAIIGTAIFGVDLLGGAHEIGEALSTMLALTDQRLNAIVNLPLAVPTPANVRFRRARRTVLRLIDAMIERRRTNPVDGSDFMSMFMSARDEDGKGMDPRQLRDELLTLVVAGHETTASTVTWCWYLLSKHADVYARMTAEVDDVLGGAPPAYDDIAKLKYTTMVIEEVMRLYPAAWVFSREAIAADDVGGFPIPAGGNVFLCPYTTHRHPAFWDAPDEFRPERFADPAVRRKGVYFPFAAGPRMCIGSSFAMMEMVLLMATIAQSFELQIPPDLLVEPVPQVTLRPAQEIRATLRRRTRADIQPKEQIADESIR